MENDNWITVKQAAKLIDVTQDYIRKMRQSGKLPGTMSNGPGRRVWMFEKSEVLACKPNKSRGHGHPGAGSKLAKKLRAEKAELQEKLDETTKDLNEARDKLDQLDRDNDTLSHELQNMQGMWMDEAAAAAEANKQLNAANDQISALEDDLAWANRPMIEKIKFWKGRENG